MRHVVGFLPYIVRGLAICAVLAGLGLSIACVLAWYETGRAPETSSASAAIPTPFAPFAVHFDPSVSYDDALRAVTDLGLQPSVACGFETDLQAGRVITNMQWQPAGQRSIFLQEHRLFVTLTPLSPPDWSARVTHLPGFVQNTEQQWRLTRYCPDLGHAAAYPSAPGTSDGVEVTPPATQPPTVMAFTQAIGSPPARVVFSPSTTYAEALYTISDLGLRLADPCYERKQTDNQPTAAAWPGAGQEQSFSASHALVVAAAAMATPLNWEQMLSSGAGVDGITVPYTAAC